MSMRCLVVTLLIATMVQPARAYTNMLSICAGLDEFCVSLDPCTQNTHEDILVPRDAWIHTSAIANRTDVFLADSNPAVALNYYSTQYARVPEGVTLQTCQPNFTTYAATAAWECASAASSPHITIVGACVRGYNAGCGSSTQPSATYRGKNQIFMYSFSEHYGCNNIPNVSQFLSSSDTPNKVLPCPRVSGEEFTGVPGLCSFECTGDFRTENSQCVLKCPDFTSDRCERRFYSIESCQGARTYHKCAQCAVIPGHGATDWDPAVATECPTTPCVAGTFSAEGWCEPCPVHTTSGSAIAQCTPCARGLYTAGPGATLCLTCFATLPAIAPVCDDGFEILRSVASIDAYFSSLGGSYDVHNTMAEFCRAQHACLPCRPGYYASAGGCIKCALGTYQPNFRADTCFDCAYGHNTTLTGSVHVDACLCQPGFDMTIA